MISLTFDTDWMQPNDLHRFLDEFPIPGAGTLFLHQPYTFLGSSVHECCPHPFPVSPEQWKDSISRFMDELGLKPTGVRTHSCIHSHILEVALSELGFQYTSNSSCLFASGIQPLRLAWGLWEMPIYYMDNLDLTMAKYWSHERHQPFNSRILEEAVYGKGLYVFDFHPLHVSLNTPSLEYYLEHQARIKGGVSPFTLRYQAKGVGTFFQDLCAMMKAAGARSLPLKDALSEMLSNRGHRSLCSGGLQ